MPFLNRPAHKTDLYITSISIPNHNYESLPYMIGGIDSIKAKVLSLVDINQFCMDGEIIAAFNVNKDGTVGNIEIEKILKQKIYLVGYNGDMNQSDKIKIEEIIAEAVKMTGFVPAYKNGQPVGSSYKIIFNLYTYTATKH